MILFSVYGTAFQIQETGSILNHIYKKRFLLAESKLDNNKFSRAFYPTSFAKTVKNILSEEPNIIESIIGFILLLPILIIGLLPFGVLFLMLNEVFCNEFSNLYGKVSFYVSLWGIALLLFYIVNWTRRKK